MNEDTSTFLNWRIHFMKYPQKYAIKHERGKDEREVMANITFH